MADDAKSFLALMNGLARKNYYGQSEITDEFLKEQIYPNLSQEEFDHLLTRCRGLLKVCYLCMRWGGRVKLLSLLLLKLCILYIIFFYFFVYTSFKIYNIG